MFKYIEKIQRKPEYIRKRITVIITVLLFVVVIFIWLFADNRNTTLKRSVGSNINTPSPITNVKNTFSSAFYNIKKEVGSVVDYTKNIKDSFNIKQK